MPSPAGLAGSTASAHEYEVPRAKIAFYLENGFVVLEGVVGEASLTLYRRVLDGMLEGRIDVGTRRADLGAHAPRRVKRDLENVMQITHPDMCVSVLDECELFRKARGICNQLYDGGDFAVDVTQFLVKFPHSDTETPWHQDQAYYPEGLDDDRACNVWCALEDATVANGCMAFHPVVQPIPTAPTASTPEAARPVLSPHFPAGAGGGALTCALPPHLAGRPPMLTPLRAGSVVVFSNYTHHWGGPNRTDARRPALVAQMRPAKAIAACRALGFDHGKFEANTGAARLARRGGATTARL